MKKELAQVINAMNSRLLLPDWKPKRSDYEKLREQLKQLSLKFEDKNVTDRLENSTRAISHSGY
jgi:hypothetical protein